MTEQAALRFYREWSIARLGQTWPDFWEWALPLVVIRGKGRGHLPESDHNRAPQFLDWHTAFHGSNWDAKAADMTAIQLRELRAGGRRARRLLPLDPSRSKDLAPGCGPSAAPSPQEAR